MSHVADINAALMTNANYDTESSVEQCKAFIAAIRQAMTVRPESAGSGSQNVKYSPSHLRTLLSEAQDWLVAHDTSRTRGGRTRFANFNRARD